MNPKDTWKVLFVPLWSRSWHMQAIIRAKASKSLYNDKSEYHESNEDDISPDDPLIHKVAVF